MINIKELAIQFFKDININLHMPYVCYDNNKNLIFLFDAKIDNMWKNFIFYKNKIFRNPVLVDYQTIVHECNSFINLENEQYKFCYTKNQYYQNRMSFFTYDLVNFKFNKNSFKQNSIYFNDKNVYYINNDTHIELLYRDNEFNINEYNFIILKSYYITCIRPIFNTNKLIFTLTASNSYEQNLFCSLIYNKQTKQFKYIHLLNKDSSSVYKCSIDPITGDLYYAKRIGTNFQDRTIQSVAKEQYELLDTNIILQQKN